MKRNLRHGKRLISGEDGQTLIAVLNIVVGVSLNEDPLSKALPYRGEETSYADRYRREECSRKGRGKAKAISRSVHGLIFIILYVVAKMEL